jgi:TonB family protein
MKNPGTLNLILASFFAHFFILFFMSTSTKDEPVKIDVSYVNTTKNDSTGQKPLKPHTPRKSLNPGKGDTSSENSEKVDLTDYGNRLKVLVDPIWIRNVRHIDKDFYILVSILVEKNGTIKSIKIIKSSGYVELDELAIQTFREVGKFPQPPEIVVQKGIEWELSYMEGK